MEKIKNEEKFSNALSVSIKCGWRQNGAVYIVGHKIFLRLIPRQLGRLMLNTS